MQDAAKDYEVISYKGADYLLGMSPASTPMYCSDGLALLFDLLALVEEPLPPYYRDFGDEAPMQRAIPADRILRFCAKYGMPDKSIPISDIRLCEEVKRRGGNPDVVLNLPDFRYHVAWLYHHFHTWQELDKGLRGPYSRRSLVKILNLGRTEFASEDDEIKAALAAEVSSALSNVHPVITYDASRGEFILEEMSTGLVALAYAQLARLLATGGKDSAQSLRFCANPECGRPYVASHGHQKYCIHCDRRVVYRQRKAKLT